MVRVVAARAPMVGAPYGVVERACWRHRGPETTADVSGPSLFSGFHVDPGRGLIPAEAGILVSRMLLEHVARFEAAATGHPSQARRRRRGKGHSQPTRPAAEVWSRLRPPSPGARDDQMAGGDGSVGAGTGH
jgi:hypothetical protein